MAYANHRIRGLLPFWSLYIIQNRRASWPSLLRPRRFLPSMTEFHESNPKNNPEKPITIPSLLLGKPRLGLPGQVGGFLRLVSTRMLAVAEAVTRGCFCSGVCPVLWVPPMNVTMTDT